MKQGDIERLRETHPLWRIGSVWASAGSGPDSRRLVASREGIQVHAWTAEELSACIAYEEEQHGSLQGRTGVAGDADSEEANQPSRAASA